jgi:hypothetical protein
VRPLPAEGELLGATNVTSVMPMKASIVLRCGSWLSEALPGPLAVEAGAAFDDDGALAVHQPFRASAV